MTKAMRGLMEQSDSNAVYLAIKHHGIVQESKTPKEGFKPIEVTNPRTNETFTKYIKRYNGIEALVNKIEWRDTGDQYDQRYMGFKIYLDADGVPCVLDLPFESRQCTRFMKLAENIDWSQPVIFRAWHDTKDDKTAFFVGQGWDGDKAISVSQKYTRDDPGECPPPVQKFNGKWNFDDQTQFLYERMINVVIPAVDAAASMRPERSNGDHADEPMDERDFMASEPEYVDPDDVPF